MYAQNQTQGGELVKLIDEDNNEIGSALRSEVRKNNLWHRASYIFLQSSKDGKFLIQKRASTKDYCPSYYDLVTGGVVSAGEDDDISAQRELQEELGIVLPLKRVCTLAFSDKTNRVWGNLYYSKVDLDEKEFKLQESEVAWIEWWSIDEILAKIKTEKITPDSIEAFNHMLSNNLFV